MERIAYVAWLGTGDGEGEFRVRYYVDGGC